MKARRVLGLSAFLLLGAFGPCAGSVTPGGGHAEGQGAPRAASPRSAVPTARADVVARVPAAPVDAPLRIADVALLSPVGEDVLARAREVASRAPDLRDDRVAKMGGSSVESRAFLHCFDSAEVELAGRDELLPTLEAFRRPSSGATSFARASLATKVGWSIRHAMGGRPPYVHRELTALRPRWALALFGSNDVEGRDDHRYAERLDGLVAAVTGRGVVPILGSIPPRGQRDREMNRWVERYNRVAWAVAAAHRLPFIDFHQVLARLPGSGLAADGVHPNVYVRRAHSYACDFSEEGLAFGQNQRNLLVLQMLDRLRRAFVGGQPEAPARPALAGAGTVEAPYRLAEVPFARRIGAAELARSALSGYAGACAHEGAGAETVFRVRVDAPTRLWVSAYGLGPVAARVFLLGESPRPDACLGAADSDGVLSLERPGVYHLVVETEPERHARDEAASGEPGVLLVVTPAAAAGAAIAGR